MREPIEAELPSPDPLEARLGACCDALTAVALAGLSFSTALVNLGMWGGLATLCWLAMVRRRRGRPAGLDLLGPLGGSLAAYVAAVAVTAPMGLRPWDSLLQIRRASGLLLAFLTANRARARGALPLFLGALALGATYASGFACYEWLHPGGWRHEALAEGRVAGPASDTIDFSARLSPLLAMGLALAMFGRQRPGVAAAAAVLCPLTAGALAMAQARANLVAIAAGLAVSAALTRKAAPAALLAALLAWALWPAAPLASRYRTIADRHDPSNQYRMDVLSAAATIARESFPWGVGRGNFGIAHEKVKQPGALFKLSSHNNYVDLLCETGILGLGAFLWMHAAFLARTIGGLSGRAALPEQSIERAAVVGSVQAFATFMTFGLFHSNWSYLLPPAVLMALVGIGYGLAKPPNAAPEG